mmetsp:Transcript_17160/g.22279  ORF Transcript_17160/g.22279 Transcript_17160/m.22279 type:complete len:286 (-) Transcript_17160:1537-2394(-)
MFLSHKYLIRKNSDRLLRQLCAVANKEVPPEKRRANKNLRRKIVADLGLRRDSFEGRLAKAGQEWAWSCSVLVERSQVILKDPEPWEEAMWKLQHDLEQYDGFDYPDNVKKKLGAHKAAKNLSEQAIPFPLAPRRTQADEDDDRTSLERALDTSLYLILKNKKTDTWFFPEVIVHINEQRIRTACEQAISQYCGDELYTFILGNAPVAVWFHELEDSDRQKYDLPHNQIALQQFFMRAVIVDPYKTGPLRIDASSTSDFAWIKKDEIDEYFPPDHERTQFLKYIL